MSEVKVFRVLGEIRKPNLKTPFRKEVIAAKAGTCRRKGLHRAWQQTPRETVPHKNKQN
jgi:hypothetical protein